MTVNVDKLHGTVAIQQTDLSLTSYQKLNIDKLYITVAIRGPSAAIGNASGSGGATVLSDTLLYQKPTSDSAVGTWTNQAGSAVLYTALSKPAGVDDSTYIVAAQNTTDTAKVKLESPVLEVGDECYVDYRIGKNYPNAPQAVDITVNLYQGATLIASWSHPAVDGPLTSITQTLTAPQVASITDYTNLFLEFVSTPK